MHETNIKDPSISFQTTFDSDINYGLESFLQESSQPGVGPAVS